MRILAVSDAHGVLDPVKSLVSELSPDLLLSCGDWGDSGRVTRDDIDWLTEHTHLLTVFGNHDDIPLLSALRNQDGSTVLLANGEVREFAGLRIAGISGIWAKSHRLPWYITDDDVSIAAETIDHTDIFLTHGCAIGLADTLQVGRHGGQMCFLRAFKRVKPQIYLCGHLHAQQVKNLSDGSIVANVGSANQGQFVTLEQTGSNWDLKLGEKQGVTSSE